MNFGEKMKILREEANLTQEVASKKMNISISALRNYEKNRLPDTYQLKQIKQFYQVPYEFLLDDSCHNRNLEYVDIGKSLYLSDDTIDKIKEIHAIDENLLDHFLIQTSSDNFWKKIFHYQTLKHFHHTMFSTILNFYDDIMVKEFYTKYKINPNLHKHHYKYFYLDIDKMLENQEKTKKFMQGHHTNGDFMKFVDTLDENYVYLYEDKPEKVKDLKERIADINRILDFFQKNLFVKLSFDSFNFSELSDTVMDLQKSLKRLLDSIENMSTIDSPIQNVLAIIESVKEKIDYELNFLKYTITENFNQFLG